PCELREALPRIDGRRRGGRMPLDVALECERGPGRIAALGPQLRGSPGRLASYRGVVVGIGDPLELAGGSGRVTGLEIGDGKIRGRICDERIVGVAAAEILEDG